MTHGLKSFVNREGLYTSRLVGRNAILKWNDFDIEVARISGFVAREWPAGSHIGLWGANSVEYLSTLFAVMRAGCVAVPINKRISARELAELATHTELSGVFTARDFPASCRAAVAGLSVWPMGLVPADADVPSIEHDFNPTQIALLMCSSGSEGGHKAVPFTLRTLLNHAQAVNAHLQLTSEDNWLACLPFFHVGGLAISFRCLTAGASLTIIEAADPEEINGLIESREITYVSVVPTVLERMLDRRSGRPYPQSLRGIITGGGPVPLTLVERCDRVLATYGLTESGSMLTCVRPDSSPRERRSAGSCLPETQVRILDEKEKPVSRGEVGEIVARGPGMSTGYFRDPDRSLRVFRNGWLHTGDLGYLDDDGFLHVLSRRTDLILSGGENIYPAEIENALLEHPHIVMAVVLPVTDATWGQVPAVAIVPETGKHLTEDELKLFLTERLASYKLPRRWLFVSDLPMLANGKPDLNAIRKLLCES